MLADATEDAVTPAKKSRVAAILDGEDVDADAAPPSSGDDLETVAGEAVLEAVASGDAKAVGRALTQALRALKTTKDR